MADATGRLVRVVRRFGGDSTRDLWVFDRTSHELLYARPDVADDLDRELMARAIDDERYGFVTRNTFESLYATGYVFTVRGFEDFDQFRTFPAPDRRDDVGVIARFDASHPDGAIDFRALDEAIGTLVDEVGVRAIAPGEADVEPEPESGSGSGSLTRD
jgi:hypothetical protein